MIEYCLDTNACIDLIRGRSIAVRARLKQVLSEGSVVCLSSIAVHELWYGVSTSERPEENTQRVQTFLAGPLEILPWDEADARAAGEIRAGLEKHGRQIGAYDALIAAQAVRRGITLVTANTREFDRIDGLMLENWARTAGPGPRPGVSRRKH